MVKYFQVACNHVVCPRGYTYSIYIINANLNLDHLLECFTFHSFILTHYSKSSKIWCFASFFPFKDKNIKTNYGLNNGSIS